MYFLNIKTYKYKLILKIETKIEIENIFANNTLYYVIN